MTSAVFHLFYIHSVWTRWNPWQPLCFNADVIYKRPQNKMLCSNIGSSGFDNHKIIKESFADWYQNSPICHLDFFSISFCTFVRFEQCNNGIGKKYLSFFLIYKKYFIAKFCATHAPTTLFWSINNCQYCWTTWHFIQRFTEHIFDMRSS